MLGSSGQPRSNHGDTIAFGDQRVRFHGIDAPESKQTCSSNGKTWNCGQDATVALANEIANHQVRCEEKDRDRYGRIVAVCYVGPNDLNAFMVRNGWALAYRRYSMVYVDEKEEARAAGVGMWRGKFMPPWELQRGGR